MTQIGRIGSSVSFKVERFSDVCEHVFLPRPPRRRFPLGAGWVCPLLRDPTLWKVGGVLPIWSPCLSVHASSSSLHNVWEHSATPGTRETLGIFLESTIRLGAAAASKFNCRKVHTAKQVPSGSGGPSTTGGVRASVTSTPRGCRSGLPTARRLDFQVPHNPSVVVA